jgi:hypothetical protein
VVLRDGIAMEDMADSDHSLHMKFRKVMTSTSLPL